MNFRQISEGGVGIHDPKKFVAKFLALDNDNFFGRHHIQSKKNGAKIATLFLKKGRGGVKGHLEIFQKFIYF